MAAEWAAVADVWVVFFVAYRRMRLPSPVTVRIGNGTAVSAVPAFGRRAFVGWVVVLASVVFGLAGRAVAAVADGVVGGVAGSARGVVAVRVVKVYMPYCKVELGNSCFRQTFGLKFKSLPESHVDDICLMNPTVLRKSQWHANLCPTSPATRNASHCFIGSASLTVAESRPSKNRRPSRIRH